MTKRIFAIVLALVLSMSLFAIDAFAADFAVTASANGMAVTATWGSVTGATEYHASLWKNGVKVGNSVENITSLSYTFQVTEAGTYTVMVCPIANEAPVTGYTAVSSNAVTVSATGSGVWAENGTIRWNPVAGVTKYYVCLYNSAGQALTNELIEIGGTSMSNIPTAAASVGVYYYVGNQLKLLGRTSTIPTIGGSSTGNVYIANNYLQWTTNYTGTFVVKFYSSTNQLISSYQTSNKTFPLSYAPSNAVRAEVTFNSMIIGSCYLTGYGSGTAINSSIYLINRSNIAATIGWQNLNSTQYYVKYTGRTGKSTTVLATSTSVQIPCDNQETVTIEITAVDGFYRGQKLTATLTPYGITDATNMGTTGTNTGNLYVTKTTYGYTVSWPSTGTLYQVAYKKSADAVYTTLNAQQSNSVVVPYTETDSWTISVAAFTNGTWQVIGTYTSTPTASSPSTGSTTIGSGCTVISSATNSTVTWSGSFGATYTVVYTADGQTARSLTTTNTSITLPVGNNTHFTVFVLANNQIIASAEVKKASTSTGTDVPVVDDDKVVAYDTVTGFWAETLGEGVVKLNWNAVEDADNYKVYYRKAGTTKWSGGTGDFVRTKTNLSIRFKNSNTYEFKIVAGKEESTVLTIKPNAAQGTVAWAMNPDADADYETNLAGVVKDADDGKITLTWEEVKGADYKVYYRKAGTTTWKGGYDRSGESITITFKASNIDETYEIMIKADGDESDIFSITPAVWANAD